MMTPFPYPTTTNSVTSVALVIINYTVAGNIHVLIFHRFSREPRDLSIDLVGLLVQQLPFLPPHSFPPGPVLLLGN